MRSAITLLATGVLLASCAAQRQQVSDFVHRHHARHHYVKAAEPAPQPQPIVVPSVEVAPAPVPVAPPVIAPPPPHVAPAPAAKRPTFWQRFNSELHKKVHIEGHRLRVEEGEK